MKITEALLGEHGVFYAQFDRIEESLAGKDRIDVLRAQAVLLAAGLEPHARLEDELLFAAVESAAGADVGPAAAMRAEHDEIEGALRRATRASDARSAREGLLEAVHLARAHFQREEQVAFPLAEEVLGEATLVRLGGDWASARGVFLPHQDTR